ncbi:AtpZ/AtpI family protein [Fodinibius halophilus]|uniref:AtpZ/AtpI family protein n=1 Tax=Fodinibius halophilus TaxID=1736908 RepID=UPI00197B045C|nr:AtpZ/AtpI family protein [Fodinibius halophilus]
MNNKDKPGNYLEYLSLGGEIAAALAVPIFLGYWLDSYFGYSPWLLLVGCLVGIVNIFILIFKLNDRLN